MVYVEIVLIVFQWKKKKVALVAEKRLKAVGIAFFCCANQATLNNIESFFKDKRQLQLKDCLSQA